LYCQNPSGNTDDIFDLIRFSLSDQQANEIKSQRLKSIKLSMSYVYSAVSEPVHVALGNNPKLDLRTVTWDNSATGYGSIVGTTTIPNQGPLNPPGVSATWDLNIADVKQVVDNRSIVFYIFANEGSGLHTFSDPVYHPASCFLAFELDNSPVLVPTSLTWNTIQGGVDLSYTVTGGPVPKDTPIRFYWANGTDFQNSQTQLIDNPDATVTVTPDTPVGEPQIVSFPDLSVFGDEPSFANTLLAVADPSNSLGTFSNSTNVTSIAYCLVPAVDHISQVGALGNVTGDWNLQTLGNRFGSPPATHTIGKSGCALTALCIVLRNAGITSIPSYSTAGQPVIDPVTGDVAQVRNDPGTLNNLLVADGGFIPGQPSALDVDVAAWAVLQAVQSSTLAWLSGQGSQDITSIVCDQRHPALIELTDAQGGYVHYVVATGMVGDQFLVNDPGKDAITTLTGAVSKWGAAGYVVRGFLTDPPGNDYSDVSIAIRGAGAGASLSISDSQGRVTGGKGFDGTEQFQVPGSDFFVEDNTDPVTGGPSGNPILIVNIAKGAGIYDIVVSPSGSSDSTYGLMIYGLDTAGIQLVPVMDALSGEQAFTITINPILPFPAFSRLSVPTITYVTASTTISGKLSANAGSLPVPAGERVLVTLDGVTHSAALDGSDDFSTSFDTRVLGASGSPYSVGFSYTGDANLNAASAISTLIVTPAPLTISADDQTKVYGDPLPTLTASYSGFVNGDTSGSLTVLPTVTTTATASSDVVAGGYPITAGGALDPNYTITYIAGALTIIPANQTITWNNPGDIIYGTPLSSTQLNAAVSVVGPAPAGTLTYNPAAGTILGPGSGQILSVTAAATNDYNSATLTVTINVVYNFSGFLPPLNKATSFQLGRTIPIKFQLSDVNGNLITTLAAVSSLQGQALDANGNAIGSPFALSSSGNSSLRNDGTQYIFNWQTKGLAAGSYAILLTLNDGTVKTQVVNLSAAGAAASRAGNFLLGSVISSLPAAMVTGFPQQADSFATRQAALNAVLADWNSQDDSATRFANLLGTGTGSTFANRLNGNYFLQHGVTVFDDVAQDQLTGSAGQDWFFANIFDTRGAR
jgi:hypothetical protein